jgi:hypothetical protein
MMDKTYQWDFPLPRTHTGMLQGNGRLGAMIWGEGSELRITLGRADLWDHRGGMPWTPQMNYASIRRLLESGDEAGMRAIFENVSPAPGQPRHPSVIPVGRTDLSLGAGVTLRRGLLKLASGQVQVMAVDAEGREHSIVLDLSMDEPILHVELPPALAGCTVRAVPAWDYIGKRLEAISFAPPKSFENDRSCGWVQALPADGAVGAACRREGCSLWIAAERGGDSVEARQRAEALLARFASAGPDALRRGNGVWWDAYWSRVPRVELPNDKLAFLYHYGMYKLAGLTNPSGVPATLQGPWIEEYQMPPWSSDYHFNINVQMCYWPAYQGNALDHVRPVLDMVWGWREQLREYARLFVGIEDGLLLPHSVDDHGQIIGGFWSGTIDHGCTAWVGKMMYDYWLYGGADEQYLREVVHPFLAGAMRVYEAMLEEEKTGDRRQNPGVIGLPVSVSPEYRGNAMNAWGRNASFQLAWIHWLIEALQCTSRALGTQPSPAWERIARGLPRASLIGTPERRRIGMWDGTDLAESHRHHSHMAGIWPIDMIDTQDATWKPIVAQTYRNWVSKGMGEWSGWCMPWAAMLHTHMGNADAAELTMEIWQKLFTNQGHGTLHNVAFQGISLMWWDAPEVMQLDAGMAATAAVMDMLIHVSRGVHHLFRGAPAGWREVGFEEMRTEGGFLVSARRAAGKVEHVSVRAERAGTFRLKSPWPACNIDVAGHKSRTEAEVVEVPLAAGEQADLASA